MSVLYLKLWFDVTGCLDSMHTVVALWSTVQLCVVLEQLKTSAESNFTDKHQSTAFALGWLWILCTGADQKQQKKPNIIRDKTMHNYAYTLLLDSLDANQQAALRHIKSGQSKQPLTIYKITVNFNCQFICNF